MRRREFLALAAGAAALPFPLVARAQQQAMPVIGFLDTAAETAAETTAFYDGLKIEGFVRNQNLAVEYRSAEGDDGRLPGLAADLVNRKVALIAAAGSSAALAAKAATTAIPIVFVVVSDPVRIGLVGNVNRPGGNITGVANIAAELEQKRLELLHELIPAASLLALLVNPANPNAETQTRDALAAAGKMGLQINVLHASAESDFDTAFAALAEMRAGGLAISNDGLFTSRSEQLAALAVRRAVPAIFQYREFAAAGGLMSYGSELTQIFHQAGVFSGLVLNGGNTADLPVQQFTTVELIVNLKAARLLGLNVPRTLLGRADEVIR
jgi:putative ABC transport system substrate-binding protein